MTFSESLLAGNACDNIMMDGNVDYNIMMNDDGEKSEAVLKNVTS